MLNRARSRLIDVLLDDWRASRAGSGEQQAVTRREWSHVLQDLPSYLTEAADWNRLFSLLIDPQFLEEKIREVGISATEEDFLRALATMPEELRKPCAAVQRALSRDSNILENPPKIVGQQLYNHLAWDWGENTVLGDAVR